MHEAKDDKYLKALKKVRRGKAIKSLVTRARAVLFLLLIVLLLLPIKGLPQRLGVYSTTIVFWLSGYLSSKDGTERRLSLALAIVALILGSLELLLWLLSSQEI